METIYGRMEQVLKKANAAFDPTLIVALVGQIITAIRGCRSPERAKAQIREGGAVAYSQAIRIVRDEGYKGREARELATDIVREGVNMTDAELDELITESKDLPQPPPAAGGFWPMWGLLLLALPSVGLAQDSTTKFWPIDAEQNRRLDAHDKLLSDIVARMAVVPSAPSVLAIANNPRQSPWVETATGRTSDDHLIRVHGYTREQIAGLTQVQKDRLHGHAHEHPGAVVRQVAVRPVQPAAVYRVPQAGGCPGGVCPIPRRFRRGR